MSLAAFEALKIQRVGSGRQAGAWEARARWRCHISAQEAARRIEKPRRED